MAGEKILGKGLGALQLCCFGAGPETGQAALGEKVDNAFHQRGLGPNNGQSHAIGLAKIGEGGKVTDRDCDVFQTGLSRSAGIAGGNVDGFNRARLSRFPGQGVFTSPATDNQYIHGSIPLISGGNGACR